MNTLSRNNPRGQELVAYESSSAEPRTMQGPEVDPARGEDFVSLATYWHVLLRRRWTVLATVLVLTTLVAIDSFKTKPIYRATSRVQVEAETPLVQSLNDLYQKMETDDAFLQTQIQVLKSEHLAWATVEQLRLGENPSFTDPKAVAKQNPEEQKVRLIAAFQGGLSVALIPRTRILTVGFESPDPRLAALVANTLVSNYIDYNFREKYDATREASGWMEKQLDELKAKVEKSQQALVDYERQHAIADVGAKDRQSIEEQMLSDLSKDLTIAQTDRIQKESLYNQVLSNRAQIASLAQDALLERLEETGAQLKQQYPDALAQYGPKFPKVVRLKEQVAENQTQIVQEQDRVIGRIRNDYVTALNREKLAIAAVNRQKDELGSANQLLVQRNILQREFDANQQLYQNLIQRLKDATVSAGLRSTNIHQVDSALAPDNPIRPKKRLNISIGLLAGIIIGIMLALAQEGLDHSLKSAEEVEALLGLPSLGVVPLQRLGGPGIRRAYGLRSRRSGGTERVAQIALTVVQKPNSVFAEAYRSLRTAILLSLAARPPKTLLITSAQVGDGKTTTALNLASVLVQRKGPVLIMDADMRKGGASKELKLDNEKGLSTVLTGTHTLDEVIQPYELLSDLWIMPAGPVPPSAADLLSSDKMAELLEKCGERFEHVVIDSPPVLSVTDATVVSPMVDGVVLVAQSGATSRGALLRMVRTLDAAGARILGVVLNKFDARQAGYHGSYYYGRYGNYGYGYGRYGEPKLEEQEKPAPV